MSSNTVFGSCSGYRWPFSEKNPKRKDLLLLGEHNGARLLFEEKIFAQLNKFAAYSRCKSQFYALPEVPAQKSPFTVLGTTGQKRCSLELYIYMFLIIFLYTKKPQHVCSNDY